MNSNNTYLTKSDVARLHIQEMILSGAVKSGDRITSREVAEALSMSETPIREAIRGLASEGWLDFHAHLGVVVSSINADQLTEVYAVRGALQALAIELGAPSYTPQLLEQLDENLEESAAAAAVLDIPAYTKLNRQFHSLLTDTPQSQWSLKLLTNLWAQTSAIHRGFETVPTRVRESLEEHRAIRVVLGTGDFAKAAELMTLHERAGGAVLVAALRAVSEADSAVLSEKK